MNRLSILLSLLVLFIVGLVPKTTAQTEKELLAQLVAEDESAIRALVLYPEETRLSILEATLHPEALIKLESIQSQTSTSFRELLEGYPQSTQEMIWDLTRYPDLVARLVEAGEGSESGVKRVLEDYPDVIHERAKSAAKYHYSELARISELDRSAQAAFQLLLDDYPPKTRVALRELIALPEVLSILTENIRLTVLIGDLYDKEPNWVIQQADSLSLVVARENAQELEDWKASLEENPEVMEEFAASAEAFAEEYGYDDDYYDYEDDDIYYDDDDVTIVHHYYYDYHYPYWFGYPYWYYYPRWRVYPYWYDWGFYWGPRRSVIVIGMPSFYYTHWYFYHPNHHYYYSNLSALFVNHYYGHRSQGSSITVGVTNWRSRNQEIVTDDWLRDDGRLSSRFREYGKFESERIKYNRAHPDKAQSQAQFAERHSKRYPTVSKAAEQKKAERGGNVKAQSTPRTQPTRTEPRTIPRTEPKTVPRPRTQPEPRTQPTPRTQKPKATVPRVKKGTDHHRSTWERSKPKSSPKVSAPKPHTSTPKIRKPRTSTPKSKKGTTRKKN